MPCRLRLKDCRGHAALRAAHATLERRSPAQGVVSLPTAFAPEIRRHRVCGPPITPIRNATAACQNKASTRERQARGTLKLHFAGSLFSGEKGEGCPGGGEITCSLDPSACSRSRARSRTHRAWASYAQLLRASGSPSASGIAARMLLTCSASAPLVPSTRRLMTLNGPPTEGRSGEGQGISGASYPEWGGLLTW